MTPEQLLNNRYEVQCRIDAYRHYMQQNRHNRDLYLDCRRQLLLWQIELIKNSAAYRTVLHITT
jgi:hypothetical protein